MSELQRSALEAAVRYVMERDAEEPPGWIWTTYPVHSSDPMVAVGHAGNEARARARVEESLRESNNSAFGVVLGPGGQQEMCRRATGGGFAWRPMPGD